MNNILNKLKSDNLFGRFSRQPSARPFCPSMNKELKLKFLITLGVNLCLIAHGTTLYGHGHHASNQFAYEFAFTSNIKLIQSLTKPKLILQKFSYEKMFSSSSIYQLLMLYPLWSFPLPNKFRTKRREMGKALIIFIL